MRQRDLYATLGIGRTASQADITHAYRVMLRRYHPDTRPAGDPAEQTRSDIVLSDVIAAYAVLGDERRRAAYDRDVGSRPQTRPERSRTAARAAAAPPIVAGPVVWRPIRRRGGTGGA